MQDFERAFHAELLLEADLESKQREDFRKLPKWIRQYAYRAWQDRIYFDRTVTWFQQEVLSDHMFCHLSAPFYIYYCIFCYMFVRQETFKYSYFLMYIVMIGLLYKATSMVAGIDLQVLLRLRPHSMRGHRLL